MNAKKIICTGVLSFALTLIPITKSVFKSMSVGAETTVQEPVIVSRESWSSFYGNKHNLTCTSIIYNDNTIDILIQNNDYFNCGHNGGSITFQSIQFNDFLYNDPIYIDENKNENNILSKVMGSKWNTVEKYINNNKNIDLKFNYSSTYDSLKSGFKLLLRFKPIIPFNEKTEIIVNDHVITINENSKSSYNQNNPGDVNNDGLVDSKDATLILKYAVYYGTTSEPEEFKVWIKDNS